MVPAFWAPRIEEVGERTLPTRGLAVALDDGADPSSHGWADSLAQLEVVEDGAQRQPSFVGAIEA